MLTETVRNETAERSAARLRQLTDFFESVQSERMTDVPILNPALAIEAVGFRFVRNAPQDVTHTAESADPAYDPLGQYDGTIGEGVLITPWFMSLIRLPASPVRLQHATGIKRIRQFGNEAFEFIANQDRLPGYFETCALFSPMGEFADQCGARDTATQVLKLLRPQPERGSPAIGRRRFLTGQPSHRAAP